MLTCISTVAADRTLSVPATKTSPQQNNVKVGVPLTSTIRGASVCNASYSVDVGETLLLFAAVKPYR